MNKIIFLISSLVIIGNSLFAQQMTLEECVNMALENNRNIKQQELSKSQTEIAYLQARNEYLPDLNASSGQSFIFGRSIGLDNTYQNTNSSQTTFGVGANITLFDGLRIKNNIDAKRAELGAANADLAKFKEDITLSVATAFLNILLQKELLKIAQNQIELTDINIEQRQKLIDNGKLAQGEIYELQAQRAKEVQNSVQTESNLKLALLDLAQIIELTDFANFDVVATEIDTVMKNILTVLPDEAFQMALVNRPEMEAATLRVKSSEKNVAVTKSSLYPKLYLGANMNTGYYRMSNLPNDGFDAQLKNNISNSVGLNLQIPIFNRFQNKNNIKMAKLNVENSILELDKAKIDLRKRIEQAYHNALSAESRWQAAQKSEVAANEAMRFTQEKFDNGRSNSYELYLAKNNLANSRSDVAQAKFEYLFRIKILELLKN